MGRFLFPHRENGVWQNGGGSQKQGVRVCPGGAVCMSGGKDEAGKMVSGGQKG